MRFDGAGTEQVMRQWMRVLAVAGLVGGAPLGGACGGSDPMTRKFDRDEQILSLLEAHRADPAKAGAAVSAYVAEHQSDFGVLRSEVEALKGDPDRLSELLKQHEARFQALMARRQKLQKEAPELFTDPKVQAALGAGM
jgi:hypothetical protein